MLHVHPSAGNSPVISINKNAKQITNCLATFGVFEQCSRGQMALNYTQTSQRG
jgi:hypothetical protein